MLKISVIIPIYNTPEQFLRECLKSVTMQTYSNAEFICVIDGATDNSAEVCSEFANADERFKIYIKENSGAGASRNYALDRTTGSYVMFMDSDDYWLDARLIEMVSELLEESGADVLSFGYQEFYADKDKPALPRTGKLARENIVNNEKAIEHLLKSPRSEFSSSIITKVIKASFILEHHIRFLEGINGEDAHFTAQLIYYAKSYDRLNLHAYAVRRHSHSTSRDVDANERVLKSMLIIFEDLAQRFSLGEEEQRTENREQRTENREQRTENSTRLPCITLFVRPREGGGIRKC